MNNLRGSTVGIAKLKARLSSYLRDVRKGYTLNVVDRETPIARLVPYSGGRDLLVVRKPTRSIKDIQLPKAPKRRTNSVRILLEDRQNGR